MKNNKQIGRFILVGGGNTLIDFLLLFGLKAIGLPVIPANIISTSVAFCVSFLANKKYTFKTTGTNLRRELLLFVIVTLFGLWVLQTLVISLTTPLLGNFFNEELSLLIAKLLATIVSLTWNYLLYSRVVFKQAQ